MMVQQGAAIPARERAVSASVLQGRAADPESSAWVAASAGSGKTKVLTDRMLRLMLPVLHPGAPPQPGTPPEKILALTFTRAGASEMAQRLSKRLSAWAVATPEKLEKDLRDLLGRAPQRAELEAARALFARVVDAPGGMKIMTIHSFCQSVLGRFPLEAGLPPQFEALEEHAAASLLRTAIGATLRRAMEEKGSPLNEALHRVAGTLSDEDFADLMIRSVAPERRQLRTLLERHFGLEGLYAALCRELDVAPGLPPEELRRAACADAAFDAGALRGVLPALAVGSEKTDRPLGQAIARWLDLTPDKRFQMVGVYMGFFLTVDKEIRARIATGGRGEAALAVLRAEAERLFALEKACEASACALLTRDLLRLAEAVLEAYQGLKDRRGALDYDDLVFRTLDLLQGRTLGMGQDDVAPWVMFKLDRGLDHILVDEAQDTNPEQWEIVLALAEEFFAGAGAAEDLRTLFVVGDEKQSIFSFQRAAPDLFAAMRAYFGGKITAAGQNFADVPIHISFRSTPSVLRLVDAVFADRGLVHTPDRSTQPGLAELWPLFRAPKADREDPWAPPLEVSESRSAAARMAEHIGLTVKGWLESGEMLYSRGRPVAPGDIMILVRTRTKFVGQLVRALKTRGIPVSGVDRMVLGEQLAVQDLCAAAAFALLPEDDLALAGLLKSPLVGWDDEALYECAYGRDSSLWQAVKSGDGIIVEWLSVLIEKAGTDSPYDFFSHVLYSSCPGDSGSGLRALRGRLGAEALDPLEEFLSAALAYGTERDSAGLQGFLQTQEAGGIQVKRQMEEAGGAVRIMTVHAAKGLQAPIVILPDTVLSRDLTGDRMLWPDRTGAALPFFVARKEDAPSAALAARDAAHEKAMEEYRRLLYVAMTRAEDRLYIGGYCGDRDQLPDSWHALVQAGFARIGETEKVTFPGSDEPALRLTNPATDAPDRTHALNPESRPQAAPNWLRTPPAAEPHPPRPLAPSRPSHMEPATASPLDAAETYRFQRGLATHTLLQLLPEIPPEKRPDAARGFVARSARLLPEKVREGIVAEALKILSDSTFSSIFGPGSQAEVPVTGLLPDGALISGQIDRLLVTEDEILVIDYKTNRPPPETVAGVPAMYVSQMRAYAAALRGVYPGRKVRAALVWTDGPRLMEIPV